MIEHVLVAQKRDPKIKAKFLRKESVLPGILYGHGIKNETVQTKASELNKLYRAVGYSTLIYLDLGGDKRTVLINQVERDPISDSITHFDLHQVKLDEKIESKINLVFVGEAPAVKELEGSLFTNKDHVNVKAFPQDLVHEIEIDISGLKTFDDAIHVKNVPVPKGIEILDDPDELVANVQPPRSEEELAALEEEVKEDVEAVEVEEKGKIEEEDAEAGALAETPKAESSQKEEK